MWQQEGLKNAAGRYGIHPFAFTHKLLPAALTAAGWYRLPP
jgi:hypothetical protein